MMQKKTLQDVAAPEDMGATGIPCDNYNRNHTSSNPNQHLEIIAQAPNLNVEMEGLPDPELPIPRFVNSGLISIFSSLTPDLPDTASDEQLDSIQTSIHSIVSNPP